MPITITQDQARHFLLAYQGLLTDQRLEGKPGVLDYIARVGCIQFDPLNVVGFNQHLVLQSRIEGYECSMLEELLYAERKLLDGWDKNMSIYSIDDWPCFVRHREAARRKMNSMNAVARIVPEVLNQFMQNGPLSSADLKYDQKVDWPWAPTRLGRAVLESLYFAGELVVHHKERTRKVYDLSCRHIPYKLRNAADPNPTDDMYWEWVVSRRIGAIGLLQNRSGGAWLGIAGFKSQQRNDAFLRLLDKGLITEVEICGIEKYPFYIRSSEEVLLNEVISGGCSSAPRAWILAPLDNLIWDRRLIKELFDFDYRWEVYKPAAERQYGYYVLPVMYEKQFVGRFEPAFDKKKKSLMIKNWWWEDGTVPTKGMQNSLRQAFEQFMKYAGALSIQLEASVLQQLGDLAWLPAVQQ